MYQLHYHIVFPVNCRKALLSEEIVPAIRNITLAIKEQYEMNMERIGCDHDHMHLLCSARPKYAPGQLMRLFKSITAREMFKRFPRLKEELWGGDGRTANTWRV